MENVLVLYRSDRRKIKILKKEDKMMIRILIFIYKKIRFA